MSDPTPLGAVAASSRPRSSALRPAWIARWVAPWLAAAATLAVAWRGRGYTADDAFITGRYALRLAGGAGYTFRDGPPTDGVTGPLLLLVEVPMAALGVDPVEASKLVGALAVALAAALVTRRLASRASGGLAALLAVPAFAVCGPLAVHGQSGLETGLATLVVTLAGLGAASRPRPRLAAALVAVALTPWLRPELVPVSWTLAAVALHRLPRARALAAETVASTPRGAFGAAAALIAFVAVASLAGVLAFRGVMFGDVVPLSARAKPTDLGNGLGYALAALSVVLGPMLVPAVHAVRTSRVDAAMALVVVVATACVILGGGDWMPGGRLLVPIAPLGVGLFAIGAARYARTSRRAAGVVVLAALLLLPQAVLTSLIVEQGDEVARSRRAAGAELRALLDRDARVVALIDVGFLAYRARFDPFDLAGVTDPAIGARPGAHCAKEVTLDDLLARDVDTLVLHSGIEPVLEDGSLRALRAHPVEQRLATDPRVQTVFEVTAVLRYAPGYWYVVMRRRS